MAWHLVEELRNAITFKEPSSNIISHIEDCEVLF